MSVENRVFLLLIYGVIVLLVGALFGIRIGQSDQLAIDAADSISAHPSDRWKTAVFAAKLKIERGK